MLKLLKVGADVETFLKNTKGKVVPACGLIGGTKKNPRPIDNLGSALQEDNVMLEMNIIPASSREEFKNNINKVLVHAMEELQLKGLTIDIAASRLFQSVQLNTDQAQQIGCMPDYNAWTLKQNEVLSCDVLKNLRTSGGHVWVSFELDGKVPSYGPKVNVVRMLDLHLGVPSIILDDDVRRRQFYGKAGAFRTRTREDGLVEYRTLSNFWIKNDVYKEWVFEQVTSAIKELNELSNVFVPWGEHLQADIVHCIQHSDVGIARKLINEHKVRMP